MPAPIVPAPTAPITSAALRTWSALPGSSSLKGSSSAMDRFGARASGGHERVDPRHRPSDDQLLDLRGPLVEGGDAHVSEVALDRVVVDVPSAAMNLDRRVRALHRRLGRMQLGEP